MSVPASGVLTSQSAVSPPVNETIKESFCAVAPPSRFIVPAVSAAWISRLSVPSVSASSVSTEISICPPLALIFPATTTLPIALTVTVPPPVPIAPRVAVPDVSPLAPALIVTPPPPVVIDEPELNVTSPAPPDPSPADRVNVWDVKSGKLTVAGSAPSATEVPTLISFVASSTILVSASACRRPTDTVLSGVSASRNVS